MSAILLPNGKQQFFTNAGLPLVGGKLYTWEAGTTTPKATYTSAAGNIPNTNPVVLNARGEATIFWSGSYKIELRDSLDNLIWTIDNVVALDVAAMIEAAIAELAEPDGSASIGFIADTANATARTAQSKMRDIFSVRDEDENNNQTSFQDAVEDIQAGGAGGTILVPNGAYTGNASVDLFGDFDGGMAIDFADAQYTSSHNGAAFTIGEYATPASEYRSNVTFNKLKLVGPGKASTSSTGVLIDSTSDVFQIGGRLSSYMYALKLTGGLISDFAWATYRDSGFGIHATAANGFSPNSLNFWGVRNILNDLATYTDSNPEGVTTFWGSEIEGNNASGTDGDGKKVTNHVSAGSINYIGSHFESNPGQYNLWYGGSTTAKNLLLAGCEVIAGAAEQVHVEQGRLTGVASRITSSGKLGTVFGANASGVLINCETDISGTLKNVACIRDGKIGFGVNPVAGTSSPVIDMRSANIIDAANIAAQFQNDTVQIRFNNTAGTRVGYLQTTTTDHILWNDNATGGWQIGAGNAQVLFVGRNGAQQIEGGGAATTLCGTAPLPWSGGNTQVAFTVTSDERAKQQIQAPSEATLRAWGRVEYYQYKLNESVEEKGDGARWHFGVVAQRVKEAFEAEGLDPFDFGPLCWDQWEDQYGEDDGGEPRLVRAAGDRFGIRYEEALALEAAYQRWRAAVAEGRLDAIERRLSKLEGA